MYFRQRDTGGSWRAAAPARAPPGAGPAAPGRGGLCSLQGPYDRSATFWGRHDRRWPKAGPEALAVAEQRAARLQSGLPAPLGQTVSPAHAMAAAYKGHVQRSTPRFEGEGLHRRWGLHCWTARQADQASCTIAKTRAANIACASANGGATHDRPASKRSVKLNFAQLPCSQCSGEYGWGGELRGC